MSPLLEIESQALNLRFTCLSLLSMWGLKASATWPVLQGSASIFMGRTVKPYCFDKEKSVSNLAPNPYCLERIVTQNFLHSLFCASCRQNSGPCACWAKTPQSELRAHPSHQLNLIYFIGYSYILIITVILKFCVKGDSLMHFDLPFYNIKYGIWSLKIAMGLVWFCTVCDISTYKAEAELF